MGNIRETILRRVYQQALKLLGPPAFGDGDAYLRQWNAVYPDSPYTLMTATGYPVSAEEILALGTARQLQYVQLGTGDLKALHSEELIPALFIENATEGFSLSDPGAGNLSVLEMMPLQLRLVVLQPPILPDEDDDIKFRKSNPVQVSMFRDALDYLMNPHVFRGIQGVTRGSQLSAEVHDAMIVLAQNLEGLAAPMEAVDYRLEITFSRQKERWH